jgi:hypothetical protein
MKKVAFFIALMVGLNATAIARRPEEEEGQAVVLKDEDDHSGKNRTSVIHNITNSLLNCFYAITKDGKFEMISWERISRIFNQQNADIKKDKSNLLKNKTNWLLMNYEVEGDRESIDYKVLKVK